MKKLCLSCFASIIVNSTIYSQSCLVSFENLKGQYSGDCNKGKADGNGEASGTDSYTGHFKNGYPDGIGKYVFKNGDWYSGSFKNGLFEGVGTLNRGKSANDSAAVITGFWKKGQYIGRHEKPFTVTTLTNNLNDVAVRKMNSTENTVTINVKSITGGSSDISNPAVPKCRLVDIQLVEGRFEQQVADESSSPVSNKYYLRKVTFPFYAVFSFQTTGSRLQVERVAIDMHENGNYYVQVSVDN